MTLRRLLMLNAVAVVAIAVGVVAAPGPRDPGDIWRATALEASQAEHYESLSSMALAADAVVVGRLRSIENGRIFEDEDGYRNHYATVKIDVVELLLGSLQPGWSLEVPVSSPDRVDALRGWLSDDKGIFFLRAKSREARELGLGQARVDQEAGYYRLVTFEAVINDDQGKASPPLPGETAFDGVSTRDFSDVVAQLRSLGT